MGRAASDQEIKSAYRRLALQYHPDRNPGSAEAEEKFKEASEAYSILADGSKRAHNDRFGHVDVGRVGFDDSIFEDFHDIFGEFFGFGDLFGGGGRQRTRARRGADLREDLTLEFEEAAFGMKTEVQVSRHEACGECQGSGAAAGKSATTCSTCGGRGQVRYQQGFFSVARTCPACSGAGTVITDPCKKCRGEGRMAVEKTLEVKIPAGVEHGTRMRYAGQGEAGSHSGPAGDLYIVLHVKEHSFFEREGKDLHCVLPISLTQAVLGAELKVPTLDGEHTLKVPEATQGGTTFRVRGKGIAGLNGHGKGDLYVQVKVLTPAKLTKRQRELLEELHSTMHFENKPERRTLLSKVKDIFG
ncbi:MAG: molecular chaperone DnaJ [Acidobacteriota bacterium]|nr:molecular chaperone DnaJ [Acidobacteriota bacterium]